jgi:hypothetical protein
VPPQEVPAFCSYPKCRREYRCTLGRGRRKAFCSDICRRTAEKELRQVKSRLAHLESLVEQARIEVASYGRDEQEPHEAGPLDARRVAEDAVTRVAGALPFLRNSDDPAAQELRQLYEAVEPIVRRA